MSAGDHCRECEPWPESLARVRSAAILVPPADGMVHALKYGGWPEMAAPMARSMARHLVELEGEAREGTLVPVPTTRKRMRTRGYNQAELLARALGEGTGRPVLGLLVRHGSGGSQVALHREERRANVRGEFRLAEGATVPNDGRPLVLVDDVLTTGATASEIAEFLVASGANDVRLLVFARTLPGRTRDPSGGDEPPPGFFHAGRRPTGSTGLEPSSANQGRS